MREAGGDGGERGSGARAEGGGGAGVRGGGGRGALLAPAGEGWEETEQFLYAIAGITGIVSAVPRPRLAHLHPICTAVTPACLPIDSPSTWGVHVWFSAVSAVFLNHLMSDSEVCATVC